MALLEVEALRVRVGRDGEGDTLVEDVAFAAEPGELVCIVGESGSGKSVTGRALLGLSADVGLRATGSALFDGEDLVAASPRRLRELRGRHLGFVPQDPQSSLDPLFTLGFQLREAIRRRDGRRADWRARALELLRHVEMPEPERRLGQYAHEMSGGQCQRALIALALAGRPRLLLADEATSALDATVKLQILELLDRLRREDGLLTLLITHDISVARRADRVVVLYAGRVVESGPADEVLSHPRHPYTAGLIASTPTLGAPAMADRGLRLPTIGGAVPDPGSRPHGCVFADRCPAASARCEEPQPMVLPRPFGAHGTACGRVLAGEIDATVLYGAVR